MSRATIRPGIRTTDRTARGHAADLAVAYEQGKRDGCDAMMDVTKELINLRAESAREDFWKGYAAAVGDMLGGRDERETAPNAAQVPAPAPVPCDGVYGLIYRPRLGYQRRNAR